MLRCTVAHGRRAARASALRRCGAVGLFACAVLYQFTLMHDPQYRVAVAWQNVAYNQPAHPSFVLGGKTAPPPPDIALAE